MSIRENSFYCTYADIAIQNYYNAKISFDKLKTADKSICANEDYDMDLIIELEDTIVKACITSTIFAAMCIESFLNDYAASNLGDDEFYSSFDKLSPEGKFSLVALIILNTKIDKSKAYYSQLKSLFKIRNRYVHNKSKAASFRGYKTQDVALLILSESRPSEYKIDLLTYSSSLNEASAGLKAMKELAIFFDTHDKNAYTLNKFFGAFSYNTANHYTKIVNRELGIKGVRIDETKI